MMTPVEPLESRDEVDFIMTAAAHNNNNDYEDFSSASVAVISAKAAAATTATVDKPEAATATVTPNIEPNSNQNSLKKSKERRTLFSFGSKKSSSSSSSNSKSQVEAGSAPVGSSSSSSSSLLLPPTPPVPIGTPPRQHKFVKSNSIARLLGNTYNARKFEREEQKRLANEASGKFHTFSGRRRGSGPYLERFKRMSKEDGDIANGGGGGVDENSVQLSNVMTLTTDSRDLQYGSRQEHVGRAEDQLSAKAMRTLTRSLGKLWWKRTHSVDISTPDPEYKVSYLGNVLTGWAKGESDMNAIYKASSTYNHDHPLPRYLSRRGLRGEATEHTVAQLHAACQAGCHHACEGVRLRAEGHDQATRPHRVLGE